MKPTTILQLLLFAMFATLAGCRSERVNCFTCIDACAPFAVSVCEPYPSARFSDPVTCSCNPYQRLDVPTATIGPLAAKGGR